jgi:hypothetical protein
MTARRKDLSLQRMGLPVHQPVPVDDIFGKDFESLEEIYESFIPRMYRVKIQFKQIERRLPKLRKAKTKLGKRYYARLLKSDLEQAERSLNDLWQKAGRWTTAWVKIRKDPKIKKLVRKVQRLNLKRLAYVKRVKAEKRRAGV